MKKDIQLTKEKQEELKKELKNLIDIERPKVIEEIKVAREQGDLSENAEYNEAKEKQGMVEGRIREIEEILANASIIDKSKLSNDIVSMGSTVLIHNSKTKKDEEIKIIYTTESNPFENKISNDSPLGSALLNKRVGEKVVVNAPKKFTVEIKKISII